MAIEKRAPKKKKATSTSSSFFDSPSFKIIKNVAILLVVILLLKQMQKINGYDWVVNKLVKKNVEEFEKYKDSPNEKLLELKIGFAATYYNFLIKNTPEDAVILFPTIDHIKSSPQIPDAIKKFMVKAGYASYFLYPRKVIYENDAEEYPDLYSQVTHVAIFNYWGYEKLPYKVQQRNQYTVLPILIPKQ